MSPDLASNSPDTASMSPGTRSVPPNTGSMSPDLRSVLPDIGALPGVPNLTSPGAELVPPDTRGMPPDTPQHLDASLRLTASTSSFLGRAQHRGLSPCAAGDNLETSESPLFRL